MFDYVGLDRRAAARALMSGLPPSQARIAKLMGVSTSTLKEISDMESWTLLDCRRVDVRACYDRLQQIAEGGFDDGLPTDDADGVAETLDRAGDTLQAAPAQPPKAEEPTPLLRAERLRELFLAQADRLVSQLASAATAMNRRQVDAIHALNRLAERLGDFSRADAAQLQNARDEEVAAALTKINDRIVHLAKKLAKELVAQDAAQ